VVKPILLKHPYAWVFFISFIVVTTFTVLNLIIGIIVNAISEEHAATESEERKAERKMMHAETAPLLREIKSLRGEITALREEVKGASAAREAHSQHFAFCWSASERT
jgi:voltage-gated sodium channel